MEPERGKVNYATVDNALAWAAAEGIPVRGHCIYWGIPNRVMDWLRVLPDAELRAALAERGRSAGRAFGAVRGVRPQQRDDSRQLLRGAARGRDHQRDGALGEGGDPNAKLFVNDYDITTGRRLDDYVKHIRKLLDAGVPLAGIGVQGHLHGDEFDPAALQKALDALAVFGLPIRITEFNMPGSGRSSMRATGRRR